MIKVVSPANLKQRQNELALAKAEEIPDFVYRIFDRMILEKYDWNGKQAVLKQSEVVDRILDDQESAISRQDVFNLKWLDVEPVYRAAGWSVEYDKADYYESESYFYFKDKP